MAEYQTKSSDSLSFDLTKDSKSIGKLSYKSWFKFNAVIELANNSRYQVEPKGFWGTTIELLDTEKRLLKFGMNWNGDIVIQTFFSDVEKGYAFKHHGIFKSSFTLTDQEETELLVMKPHLKWSLMNYEYQITTSEAFEALPEKEILLMNSIHCANYYMSMIANVTGA
ncbi:hypothetical protein [Dyadobacter pollutisoli]|jgi:hypothetical protein|uniref:Uncharacterized protein n=1 Tax=Dyadobacter pollutisoli TaxID=2910158 RepID=A0A9E8NA25_9BACT|nr:hypothetical protein [Dyadobacter pollutisoli]WAC10599.1 hypothetical protein ON006_22990 [Dyadobacter pollutisoli]